jgi:nucleotide-binding universal stress UspA family protein
MTNVEDPMAYKDILIALTTYPERTPDSAVQTAVALAGQLGGRTSALACKIKISAPGSIIENVMLDLPSLIAAEQKKSVASTEALLAIFRQAAERADTFQEFIIEQCSPSEISGLAASHARLHDLTIVPVPGGWYVDQWYAESIIFGSGRPTIIISQEGAREISPRLDTILVAWDFSRPASRAVFDALPIMRQAKRVFVTTITNEKRIDPRHSGSAIAKYLARHGIEVVLDVVDVAGRTIGAAIEAQVVTRNADLLVMGAYGHSRLREFLLGGATRSMLAHAPVPILMSH